MNGLNPKILNALAKQQHELAKNLPDGVIFYQNEDGDVLDIQADIIGPQDTPFHNGFFRCKLVIDGDFPTKPPKGYFLTKIFHPNVSAEKGEICVNTLKRDWDPAKWSLSHIFQIIKCLLIVPFPESSLNDEAGKLFMESYDEFFNQAKLYTSIHARPSAQATEMLKERESQKSQKMMHKQEQILQLNSDSNQTISLSGLNSQSQVTGVLGLSQVQNSISFGQQQNGNAFGDKNFNQITSTGQHDQSNAQNLNLMGNQNSGLFEQNNTEQMMFGSQENGMIGDGFNSNIMGNGFSQLGMGMSQPQAPVMQKNKSNKAKKPKCRI